MVKHKENYKPKSYYIDMTDALEFELEHLYEFLKVIDDFKIKKTNDSFIGFEQTYIKYRDKDMQLNIQKPNLIKWR